MASTEYRQHIYPVPSSSGRLFYKPRFPGQPDLTEDFSISIGSRPHRSSRITVEQISPSCDSLQAESCHQGAQSNHSPIANTCCISVKLAASRDNSFLRRLHFLSSQNSQPSKSLDVRPLPRRQGSVRSGARDGSPDMPSLDFVRHGGNKAAQAAQREENSLGRLDIRSSTRSARLNSSNGFHAMHDERPVAMSQGISMSVHLTEPHLFLQGYDFTNSSTRSTAMLRGTLHLKVSKPTKVKAVSLRFRGLAQTRWPEGKNIPTCYLWFGAHSVFQAYLPKKSTLKRTTQF